jgi:DNA mismatch repair protein MutS
MTIIKEYLSYTTKYVAEYGEKTLVLMQVGSFFEAYGLLDSDDNIYGSKIEEFSRICEMVVSRKRMCVGKARVVMAGFGLYVLEKYVKKLQAAGYTTVVYTQDTQAKNTTRSLAYIFSPGTFFTNDTEEISNSTSCIWVNTTAANTIMESRICVGMSNIDIFTGKTSLFQYNTEFHHNPSTYDELERFISIHTPIETIIITNLDKEKTQDIIQFANIQSKRIHTIFLEGLEEDGAETENVKCAKNSEKQIYQREIIKQFYPDSNNETFFDDFYDYDIATQAFCFLLNFIHRHNPNLVANISPPLFENYSDRLVLANHSLKQLNMIDDARYRGKLSSVSKFLNNCVTIMGKRQFNYQILNPITDKARLNKEYDITEYLLDNFDKSEHYRKELSSIKDIEKLKRKLILRKITPKDLYILDENLSTIKNLFDNTNADSTLKEYFTTEGIHEISKSCGEIKRFLGKNLDLSKAKHIDDVTVEKLGGLEISQAAFIKKGMNEEIDKKVKDCLDSREKLESIKKWLSDKIRPYERSKKPTQYVKIHETPKMEATLLGTKRRVTLLKREVDKEILSGKCICPDKGLYDATITLTYKSKYTNQEEELDLDLNNIDYVSLGSNKKDMSITSPEIKEITKMIQSSKDILINEMILFYRKFIDTFLNYETQMGSIVRYATCLDILQSRVYIAQKYNYCKPKIEDSEKSFVDAREIRHCLIEHLQTNELYVTNNVILGRELDGMLLYGTNAVGKTSLIKALGISIIMAQAGLYVPCAQFTYCPYNYLFTRILGNDNLFKGLSTFAVEMSELRTILNLSTKDSLILGDELCSGTESDSALSIFMAGLERLSEKKCSFIFATHFHEIKDYDELKVLENMKLFHMSVIFDKKTNKLVYDRKLKDGPGESMYGLEVCKALALPDDFLVRAHALRNKYNDKADSVLSRKTSHFNSKKIKGMCEVCHVKEGKDVHHLQHQKYANENNKYINSFHKDHLANLTVVCQECHDKFHEDDCQYKKVNTSFGVEIRGT